jgi:pyridoxine 4-dehydrogenase
MQAILGDRRIDVYSYARLPPKVPVEEVFGNLETLRKEGLFDAIGASEMSAASLRKAATVSHRGLFPLSPAG